VSNRELRDFCRGLPSAGVGYYPNSWFVHLDARDERSYWVDYSRPGEAPRYGREDRPPEGEAASDVEATATEGRPRRRPEAATMPAESSAPDGGVSDESEDAAGEGPASPPVESDPAAGAGASRSVEEAGGPSG
jgi:hypothetical protein